MSCAATGRYDTGAEYDYTAGIAEVERCERYEGRDDGLVEKCKRVTTDAFSGWEAITQGVVRMFTFGLLP